MMDYKKLFQEGNFVLLRNTKTGEDMQYIIDRDIDTPWDIPWDEYMNPGLSYATNVSDPDPEASGETIFKIMKIATIDTENDRLIVLYDRKQTPMPTMQNGDILVIHTPYEDTKYELAIYVDNKLYYQNGGWDYFEAPFDQPDNEVGKHRVISVYRHGCGFAYRNICPIWGVDYFHQTNVKENTSNV